MHKAPQSHLGGLELPFPLRFTPFRLALPSITGSVPLEQEGLCTLGFALLGTFWRGH